MKGRFAWFSFGFISAIILLAAIGYFRNRPQNAADAWPKEIKEMMLTEKPWLKSARAIKVGPFVAIVPATSSQKTEAIISPTKGYPQIFITEDKIDFIDSKNRYISIKYSLPAGEIKSYEFCTSLINGTSFYDNDLDGQFDLKIEKYKNFAVYYESKWYPVIRKEKKKYLEVNGAQKEIEIKDFNWKFVQAQ